MPQCPSVCGRAAYSYGERYSRRYHGTGTRGRRGGANLASARDLNLAVGSSGDCEFTLRYFLQYGTCNSTVPVRGQVDLCQAIFGTPCLQLGGYGTAVPKYGTVLHGTQVWYGTACFCYAAAVLYLRVGRCTCSYSCTSATCIYVPVHVQIYTTCRYRYLTVAQLNLSTSYVAVVLCTTASRYH